MEHIGTNKVKLEHLLFKLTFILSLRARHICLTYISAIILQNSLKVILGHETQNGRQ
jgi:hypothetical protein